MKEVPEKLKLEAVCFKKL